MKVLLHACCGPCSLVPVRALCEEGAEVFGAYVNPNIHPYTEWQRRLEGLQAVAEQEPLRLLPPQPYALREWLRGIAFRESERCRLCYYQRLRSTALMARRGRFEAFSTTLLYSKFQKHEMIAEIGTELGREVGVPFLYRDWRTGWSTGVERSKAMGLYRQQYCGCIYSEEERYVPRPCRAEGRRLAEKSQPE